MRPARHLAKLLPVLLAFALAVGLLSACGSGSGAASGGSAGRLRVVAVEDFWGSIAAQLGGDRVEVTNIVTSPSADPHDYEPTSEDARTMATAQLAIVNGIGYDTWATKLLEAEPNEGRTELDVGSLLGLADGDNPHRWYSPPAVQRVIDRITADYERADPAHKDYFEQRRQRFERTGLAEYHRLIERIRSRYGGTPVGASESIFAPMAAALGLDLVTPESFLNAVSEGTEPTPADRVTVDRQLSDRKVRIWVYNSQNATPDVQRLNDAASAAGIPIATVTETPTPEGVSFQDWQVGELRGLEAALAESGSG